MTSSTEAARTYDVAEDIPVPPLETLPQVAVVDPPRELHLEAVYYDTEDLALSRGGISLRRRAGGDDDGWHLTLPGRDGDRHQRREQLGDDPDGVPEALSGLIQVRTRGRAVAPVATLRTRRVVRRLLDGEGVVLAEFCDDTVTSESAHGEDGLSVSSWREWEVELVDGRRRLLAAADDLAVDVGARPAVAASALARALAGRLPAPSRLIEREPSKDGPAAVVVLAHLRSQVEELELQDLRVRRDEPDSVHKMRVATRRLRSALATFKPLLDPDTADEARAELRWLAQVLGEARDAEVMRDRLTDLVTEQAPEVGQQHASGSFAEYLAGRYVDAHARAVEALGSTRYFRLLDALDRLAESPPWTPVAELPARDVLPARARKEWKRMQRNATAAEEAPSVGEQDVHLHELRKAAKRMRYACEALAPTFGPPAERSASAAEDLQEVLGDHQDSVVSQELLRELAGHSEVTGEDALILGRLHLLEQEHAERSRGHYEQAWKRNSDKALRRWMR